MTSQQSDLPGFRDAKAPSDDAALTLDPARLIMPKRRRRQPPAEVRLLRLRELPTATDMMDTPERVAEFWRRYVPASPWWNPDVESMVCFTVNSRRRITSYYLIAMGTLDSVLTHPREVFKTAIVMSASALILAHNHPSGDPTPSEADIKTTRDLIRAGQVLRIEVLDHVIVGKPSPERGQWYCSLRELGYFYAS
ncbi:MAG: JAB domain-containing protein [Verrucomicrobia bacterium]|nr:JAB domain-containing protein [Verrucomicrobiota bacterium]